MALIPVTVYSNQFTSAEVTFLAAIADHTYTDGQLIIGKTSTGGIAFSTLTAGANITITNGSGTITIASSGGASGITIGTTTITSGTDTRILYDNAGVVGEYTLTGTGTVVAMATAAVLTSPTITTKISPTSDDGAPLGDTTHNFSDLFLASGAVINIANSNWVATHTSAILTVGTGDLRVTTAGTNAASVVTVGGTQTLTAKTLTSPVIGTSPTAAGATWTDAGSVTTIDINGGTVDGVTIGGASAGNITGLVITANTSFLPDTDGGAALGAANNGFTILGLSSGSTINFANSNVVLTHSSGILTMGTGELRNTNAGTNTASVVTVGGTQTLTAKTLTSPAINTGTIGTSLVPTSNDGAALGNTTNQFSDLFLAEGGVINWDNGDATCTQTNNTIAWAGIDTFNVGTSTAVGLGTIELGAASDTTIARVSAGVVSIEGVNIMTVGAADTVTGAKTMSSIILPDQGTIRLTTPTTDLKVTGFTTSDYNSGYSSTAIGDLVYLDSSATWQKCDANTLALYNGLLGIAVTVAASGAAVTVALPGSFIYSTTGFPTFTIGSPLYMSETAGAITGTAPTTTDAATRVVGWGVHADKMYFFPSPDYITHT